MSNFQSYSTFIPSGNEELFTTGPSLREDAPVYRSSSINGTTTDSVEQSIDRGDSGHTEKEGWKATARSEAGRAIAGPDITAETLLTFDGMQAKASFWVSEGRLTKGADGTFSEGQAPAEAPPEVQGDISVIPDSIMEGVNAALAPLPQSSLDSIIAHGMSVATGRSDDASLTKQFAISAGLELADSHERLTAVKAVYQAQADQAIKSRAGIGAADAPEFWSWCRANHQGQLQDAIGKQLHGADVSGYTKLANQWLSTTAPSIAALQAAGIPTRTQGSSPEVYLKGTWMSPTAAARAGLV